MIQILSRRFPGLHIRLFPALVQGEGSIEEICRGLDYFSRGGWAELVIVARGGGSLEDLWTFNEEAVARAIARCAVPVVSAVGHETDVTIADFVADLRAPTPSAAAEMIVCTRQELLDRIAGYEQKLQHGVRYRLAVLGRRWQQQGIERPLGLLHRALGRQGQRVDELEFRLRDSLRTRLERSARMERTLAARLRYFDLRPRFAADRRRLDSAYAGAIQSARWQLALRQRAVGQLSAKLSQLSPLLILERGYAIVSNESGAIVTASEAAPPGSLIQVRLAKGGLDATVSATHVVAE
jgi:exodeoxyribonuclease VII large subunit